MYRSAVLNSDFELQILKKKKEKKKIFRLAVSTPVWRVCHHGIMSGSKAYLIIGVEINKVSACLVLS